MVDEFSVEDKLCDIQKIRREIEKLQEQERKTWDEIERFEARRMRGPFWRVRAWAKRGDSELLRLFPAAYILFLALGWEAMAQEIFSGITIFDVPGLAVLAFALFLLSCAIVQTPAASQQRGRRNGSLLLFELAILGALTLSLLSLNLL